MENTKKHALVVSDLLENKENLCVVTLEKAGYEVKMCKHDSCFDLLFVGDFQLVIVNECEDGSVARKFKKGDQTYKLLRNSLSETVKILRVGFMKRDAENFLRLPFGIDELRTAVGEVKEVLPWTNKPIVLVVEDDPQQLVSAKAILLNDFQTVFVTRLDEFEKVLELLPGNISGIITDLHFPQIELEKDKNYPPAGLAVVAYAVENNIPVVVCSDINHHYAMYLKDIIRVLSLLPSYTYRDIPFSQDNKDWEKAKTSLQRLLKS